MPQLQLIDTVPAFLAYWKKWQNRPMAAQIEAWADHYLDPWPELRQMQLDCYAEEGEDWRAMARTHVFPFLPDQLEAMLTAHDNLLAICADMYGRGWQTLDFDSDLVGVIYVGIGIGAGWVTTYAGKPAILFGLENIAAEEWQSKAALTGLMAHEFGHVVHFHWRERAGLADETGPWWQLYIEGFAMWCEQLIQDRASWHIRREVDNQWESWCQENVGWLAGEFLRRVDEGEDLRPFFGSWFELQGVKQTGYFLGYELVKRMRETASLEKIALLQNIASHCRPLLAEMAG